ncbi:UNVERIFIED_CONTAM: hypothetical protein GTU68_012440 [Idotea baltica]|nr:hypothetical protein [Idotea baltica]
MSKNKRKYFGTDGIRGVAGVAPLNPETLVRLGKALAITFRNDNKSKHRILIGKDTRLSGYMIETALASGLTSMGMNVELVGPLPTPGIAYLTTSMRADAGIVISASHNPYEDNGIKVFGHDGYKLADEKELEIEKLIESDDLIGQCTEADAVGRYTVYLKSCFARDLSLKGLKVGFDCANGAGYVVAGQTCRELGADVEVRGASPSGKNINAGFGSLYPEIVKNLVLEQNLDIGVALDGDADRALLVDEKGNLIDGDSILTMAAIYLKKIGELPGNRVVATVMSNIGLEKALSKHDIKVVRANVGDRYVLEEMLKNGSMLGGEQSGHTIFRKYATTGDGILSGLKVMELMQREERPLSELASQFEKFPQKLINIKVNSKPELNLVEGLTKIIETKEKELKEDGRVLVRYSGTENKARVMVECSDEANCNKHAEDIAEVIEKAIGSV